MCCVLCVMCNILCCYFIEISGLEVLMTVNTQTIILVVACPKSGLSTLRSTLKILELN